jgi:hypothetical protein
VFRRLLHLLTAVIGVLGVAICVAAGAVVWLTGARLIQANENVFDRVDTTLAAGRDRVLDVQRRVQESKITTEDVRQGVENWARREGSQRLASRPEVDLAVDRLSQGLRQADAWLELSGASLQTVQQTLDLARTLGASGDGAVVDPLLDRLSASRRQLAESTETVDAVREWVDRAAEGETLEERISRLAQLTLRVVTSLSDIDARLGQFADGFTATRARGQQLKNQTHRYIVTAAICALVLIAWMAIGQFFLGRHGWTHYQRQRRVA